MIQLSSVDHENSIVLLKGANFGPSLPLASSSLSSFSHLLVQNEIPLSETTQALEAARIAGLQTIYNPSPIPSDDELRNVVPWGAVDWVVINEGEARDLLSVLIASPSARTTEPPRAESEDLLDTFASLAGCHPLGNARGIVVTLGASGVAARIQVGERKWEKVRCGAGHVTEVKDTTGAGDCFTVMSFPHIFFPNSSLLFLPILTCPMHGTVYFFRATSRRSSPPSTREPSPILTRRSTFSVFPVRPLLSPWKATAQWRVYPQ
jgi:sugar/nucleoside kinase (ribokinase family)